MSRVVHYFFDVHLCAGHYALTKLAEDHGIKARNLAAGEFVVFYNRSRTAMKLLAANDVVVYWKPKAKMLPILEKQKAIPQFYSDGPITISKMTKNE